MIWLIGLVYDYLNCSFGVASCLLVVVLIWLLVGVLLGVRIRWLWLLLYCAVG